ncbi:helix-turn-helix domain-containing protein [Sphingorhabdus sp. 109]|uniref:helix-turn-helix domain-containing protein n=1 Tax=Sphingorhabdus sp. 109 TaxID=2653173 RepID=UPI0012F3929F|nr:helix-turn-helix domain-containing protein [Sphingorhabdus sp. 109]VWX62546.1 conserved hypothetical protein [Sphingorhabdus sp. 109]
MTTGSALLDDIAVVIGVDAALQLSWRFRGQDLYIPKDIERAWAIVDLIGEALAQQLSDNYHGTTIPVPKGPGEKFMVLALAEEGLTRQKIADRLGIGERQVYRILSRQEDPRQHKLSFL